MASREKSQRIKNQISNVELRNKTNLNSAKRSATVSMVENESIIKKNCNFESANHF